MTDVALPGLVGFDETGNHFWTLNHQMTVRASAHDNWGVWFRAVGDDPQSSVGFRQADDLQRFELWLEESLDMHTPQPPEDLRYIDPDGDTLLLHIRQRDMQEVVIDVLLTVATQTINAVWTVAAATVLLMRQVIQLLQEALVPHHGQWNLALASAMRSIGYSRNVLAPQETEAASLATALWSPREQL